MHLKIENDKSNFVLISLILLMALILRVPFFYAGVLNWDESSYLIEAQSLLNGMSGNYFSVRSYLYSFIVWLVGENIYLVRLIGALFVGASAIMIFLICSHIQDKKSGIVASLLFITWTSIGASNQALMSEHLAITPLLASLWILIKYPRVNSVLVSSGFFVGIAVLTRLNLAFVAIAIGMYLFVVSGTTLINRMKKVTPFVVGGVIVLLLSTLPYFFVNEIESWWPKNFGLAIEYASEQKSIYEVLIVYIAYIIPNPLVDLTSVFRFFLLWLPAIIGAILLLYKFPSLKSGEYKNNLGLIYTATISVLFSILAGGQSYSHYLLQIFPFAAILGGVFISNHCFKRGSLNQLIIITLVVCIVSFFSNATNRKAFNDWFYGHVENEVISIDNYLESVFITDDSYSIYILNHTHQLYFIQNKLPPSPIVLHPSNISKEYLFKSSGLKTKSTLEELESILSSSPDVIIKSDKTWYIDSNNDANKLLNFYLEKNYIKSETIKSSSIYINKELTSSFMH